MQIDQPPASNNGYSTPAQFRVKLGSYLTGIVIGFTLLGMIYFMKHLATQSQQAPGLQQPAATETETMP